jgi:hypothetical protein
MKAWKIILGALLLLADCSAFANPNRVRPENRAQALGMVVGVLLIAVAGVWLIVSGIRGKGRQRDPPPKN